MNEQAPVVVSDDRDGAVNLHVIAVLPRVGRQPSDLPIPSSDGSASDSGHDRYTIRYISVGERKCRRAWSVLAWSVLARIRSVLAMVRAVERSQPVVQEVKPVVQEG